MTLNLLWSDDEFSYIIVDSARTHPTPPKFSYSTLGQSQILQEKNLSVEEGVQKIIPLNGCVALGLCGNEVDVLEFATRYRLGLAEANIYTFTEYFKNLPKTARLSISVGTAGTEPPFFVFNFPERQIIHVLRGHTCVTGTLTEDPKNFLKEGIRRFLIESNLSVPSEYRLAIGLAIATAMSANYNLTNDFVGGAFFGARLDKENFFWQPDIVYVFYGPNFSKGIPSMSTPDFPMDFNNIENAGSRLDLITCRVRDDVSVVMSTLSNCGVAWWSPISGIDINLWTEKWSGELSDKLFYDTKYIAFTPKIPGVIAVLPNDGEHIRMNKERISLSDSLVEILKRETNNIFEIKIIDKQQ